MGRQRQPERAGSTDEVAEKCCERCGRRIAARRKWAGRMEEVRYCSAACRKAKLRAEDRAAEAALLAALRAVPQGRSVPVDPHGGEVARMAARRIVARGEAELVQGGRLVDPSTARGPIYLRQRR